MSTCTSLAKELTLDKSLLSQYLCSVCDLGGWATYPLTLGRLRACLTGAVLLAGFKCWVPKLKTLNLWLWFDQFIVHSSVQFSVQHQQTPFTFVSLALACLDYSWGDRGLLSGPYKTHWLIVNWFSAKKVFWQSLHQLNLTSSSVLIWTPKVLKRTQTWAVSSKRPSHPDFQNCGSEWALGSELKVHTEETEPKPTCYLRSLSTGVWQGRILGATKNSW